MKTAQITANGWNYTIEVDDSGKIQRVACERRFPMTNVKFIGDDWMIADLQRRMDALTDGE